MTSVLRFVLWLLKLKIKQKEVSVIAKEKVNNPKTHKATRIRQRTTSKGRKGQFMGPYHKRD